MALLAVGLWVFWLAGSPAVALADAPVSLTNPQQTFSVRWVTLCILLWAVIICLPRQCQVTVVENSNEHQLRTTASWLFPLYLFVFCLLVVAIAVTGLNRLLPDTNPDLYVLTLPLDAGQDVIALMAFIGGFSSTTSMVIVSSTIALATMISNHIVTLLALRFSSLSDANAETVRSFILGSRRASILFSILLGFFVFLPGCYGRGPGRYRPDLVLRRGAAPAGAGRRALRVASDPQGRLSPA